MEENNSTQDKPVSSAETKACAPATTSGTEPPQNLNHLKNSPGSETEPSQTLNHLKNSTTSKIEVPQKLNRFKNCGTTTAESEVVPPQNLRWNDTEYNKTEWNKIYPIHPSDSENRSAGNVGEQVNLSGGTSESNRPNNRKSQTGVKSGRLGQQERPDGMDRIDGMDETDKMDRINADLVQIRKNLAYDTFMNWEGYANKKLYGELYELVCDIICSGKKSIRIGGVDYPYQRVRDRFMQLNNMHFEYIIKCMSEQTGKVRNIKAYMLSSLYNAPVTIGHFYQTEVQHDMYGAQ